MSILLEKLAARTKTAQAGQLFAEAFADELGKIGASAQFAKKMLKQVANPAKAWRNTETGAGNVNKLQSARAHHARYGHGPELTPAQAAAPGIRLPTSQGAPATMAPRSAASTSRGGPSSIVPSGGRPAPLATSSSSATPYPLALRPPSGIVRPNAPTTNRNPGIRNAEFSVVPNKPAAKGWSLGKKIGVGAGIAVGAGTLGYAAGKRNRDQQ